MRDLMFGEFAKYQVLPLDASAIPRWVAERPSVTAGRKEFTYLMPVTGLPDSVAPQFLNTSFTITADIDVPQGGGEGSIVAEGGRFGGYGLHLLKGKPVFTYNQLGLNWVRWEAPQALSPGRHTIRTEPLARYPRVRPQPDVPLFELFMQLVEAVLEPGPFNRNPQTAEPALEQVLIGQRFPVVFSARHRVPKSRDIRWLVSRFRSSQAFAAHSDANFGIKGTRQVLCF